MENNNDALDRKIKMVSLVVSDIFILYGLLLVLKWVTTSHDTLLGNISNWVFNTALYGWLLVVIVVRVHHWISIRRKRRMEQQGAVND